MPLYKAEIFKSTPGSDDWCNTYHIQASDLSEASTIAGFAAVAEQVIHQDYVLIERARVSQVVPNTDDFETLVLNIAGSRSAVSLSLPLWNTFRVDFGVAASRPSRKYIRGPVLQVDQNGDVVQSSGLTIMASYITAISAQFSADGIAPGLVDESGNPFTAAIPHNRVVLRPLHRNRRRISVAPPLS